MREWIRRNVWLWPLAFALLLAVVAWTSLGTLESTMRDQVRGELQTTLDSAAAALEIWAQGQQAIAEVHAADPRVQRGLEALEQLARESGEQREVLLTSPALAALRARLDGVAELHGFTGWGSISRSGLMLANGRDDAVGLRPRVEFDVQPRVMRGETVFTPPLLWEATGDATQARLALLVGAPVRDSEGNVIASLGFSIDPGKQFSRILNVARPGESGETYAFDRNAVLVSRSRFEAQLRQIGVLDPNPEISSQLSLQIRDPGGNMAEGFAPSTPLRARPLTRMAASAIEGGSGVDLMGYPDYRGVPVVGAWTQLPELELYVATEMDVAEAYHGLAVMRRSFFVLIGLLVVGALGMLGYSSVIARLQSQVDEARQLGRYRIERKIGKGGMGTVYLAKHALLRRPTAIKVLDASRGGEEALARFEREVQVTSSLRHPNTIEIYDYGYTPDGTFYYAMECVSGITLDRCVDHDGAQPEARVVHILLQACASLAEAHAAGLIHRDIKPSNIMLAVQGGMHDFVKVLDFGLVREQQQTQELALTQASSLTGTPLFMSPEAVERPEDMDARSDVYQLGGIAYYLLTGRTVFEGTGAVDVLAKHLHEEPKPPSALLEGPISADLEQLILRCLAKAPDERPKDARELQAALESCATLGEWTSAQAEVWWLAYREQHPVEEEIDPSPSSVPSAYSVDVKRRRSRG